MTEIDTSPEAQAPATPEEEATTRLSEKFSEIDASPEVSEPEHTPAETAQSPHLNRVSAYIHVGAGAESCEHGEDGACEDSGHFHAWCRLPNQFERQDLQEHAAAAAARKRRALRDPESNVRVIVDGELESILHRGDRDLFVTEIVSMHFLEDHLDALRQVEKENEEYVHIDDDKERLRVLEEMPADERPEDEVTNLRKHVADHNEKVTTARAQLEEPRRLALADRSDEDLMEIVRDQRIDTLANTAHSEEYAAWEWYICTFQPKAPTKAGWPVERYYPSMEAFRGAPSEALEAIAGMMTTLEREAQENLKGSLPLNHG